MAKKEMYMKLVSVTPDMAAKALNNTHNRKVRQWTVDKMARDMKAGNFPITHQPAAFDPEGVLIDGQHRFWAVLESGKTIKMWIAYNAPRGTQLYIDDHLSRTPGDYLTLTGEFGVVSQSHAAILKRMLVGCTKRINNSARRTTHAEIHEAWKLHEKAVKFAIHCFPKKKAKVTTTPVLAVIARAYYSPFAKEEIRRFCEMMVDSERGAKRKVDRNPISLREDLLKGEAGHSLPPVKAFIKTQVALEAYLLGRVLTKFFQRTPKELFRLPNERHDRALLKKAHAGPQMRRVLGTLARREYVTSELVGKQLKITTNAARIHLEQMVKYGWLKKDGPGTKGKPAKYRKA